MRPPDIWLREDRIARWAVAVLAPIGWIYGASVAFKSRHASPFRPSAKVICVGNVTSGGSGKTPVAIAIASALVARGQSVSFLSRGYGGEVEGPRLVDATRDTARDVGDEPLLLAAIAPTIVARDRRKGAMLADAHQTQVIVMDDGHQNFTLVKDLSLVVVDAASGFGNGRVLPAGPLREPASQALARADAVVLIGDGDPDLCGFTGPALRARIAPAATDLKGRRVVAFAGIGRPAKFFDTLENLGVELAECRAFADHHSYQSHEIAELKALASTRDALLVTTEKDFVRLDAEQRTGIVTLPVSIAFDRPEALGQLLDRIAQ